MNKFNLLHEASDKPDTMETLMKRKTVSTSILSAFIFSIVALSGCAHAPVKTAQTNPNDAQSLADEKTEEALFTNRAIAADPIGSEIISEAVSLLSRGDQELFVQEAQNFLSTYERLTAANVATHFTQEQGLSFLNHLRETQPHLAALPALSGVYSRVDTAMTEATQNLRPHAPSNLTTGINIVSEPELMMTVNRLKNIDPALAGDAYHIWKKLRIPGLAGVSIADQKFCQQVEHFSQAAKTKISSYVKAMRDMSDAIAARRPQNIQACFWEAAANTFAQVMGGAENAQHLGQFCFLTPSGSMPYLNAMVANGSRPNTNLRELNSCN
jgi:hypothetical protein